MEPSEATPASPSSWVRSALPEPFAFLSRGELRPLPLSISELRKSNMAVSKWVALALCAASGVGLVSSTAGAAPAKKARETRAIPSKVATDESKSSSESSAKDIPTKDVRDLKDVPKTDANTTTPPKRDGSRPNTRAAAADEPTQQAPTEPLPPPSSSAETPETPKATAPADGDSADEATPKEHPEGSTSLAVGAPAAADEASLDGGKLRIHPYLLVTGGLKADFVKNKPGEEKNDRISTFALGRIGLRARWLDFVYAESEFMASGGVGLHGTSAYEGQAAMQVRQQLVRLTKYGFRVEVGRILDEASVDFFSAHVAETFIQDTATRDPLLFSGFNLGNGVRATYQIIPGLRAGLTFNAGNPVSNTASLMVGGAYPPFERFYTQPYQQVNQSANHFPDDTFHSMVITPSVLVDTKFVDVRVAVQGFDINANTNSSKDDHIRGYNLRGTAKVKLFDGLIIPFASSAYTRNDTLVATDLSKRAPDRYQAVNLGVGVDVDLQRRFKCSHDCADGFGGQFQQVQYQIGDNLVTTQRYLNIGATYWLAPNVSVGARFAMWLQEQEQPVTAAGVALGQTRPDTVTNGERSVITALRFIMP